MNKSGYILGFMALVLVDVAIYFSAPKNSMQTPTPTPTSTTPTPTPVGEQYKNTEYGFSFDLPDSWKGFTTIEDEWDGDTIVSGQVKQGTVHGPLVSIRHPDWDYKAPRQDIPVMVFTIQQWNDMQADKFHIGAAPINPSEIGRNKKYVFAIPARYNFAYLTGFEEVDQIIKGDNFQAF